MDRESDDHSCKLRECIQCIKSFHSTTCMTSFVDLAAEVACKLDTHLLAEAV